MVGHASAASFAMSASANSTSFCVLVTPRIDRAHRNASMLIS
jgi:hypothetical protein